MSTGGDSNAVGTTHLIDGRVWTVVAVYPIRVTSASYVTGDK